MNRTVGKNLAAIAILVASAVMLVDPSRALAQRRPDDRARYRNAQYEQQLPAVELPPPEAETDVFSPDVERVPSTAGGKASALPGEVVLPNVPLDGPVWEGSADAYAADDPALDDAAPVFSTGTWYYRGRWYTQMDFVVLIPTVPRREQILTDLSAGQNPVTGAFLVTYDNRELASRRYTGGTRLTLGRFLGRDVARRDHLLDFSFLGLFEWSDQRTIISRGGGALVTNLNTGLNTSVDDSVAPYLGSDEQSYAVDTDFNSFELNYRIRTRPGRDQLALTPDGNWVRYGNASQMRSAIAGLRGMSYNEQVVYGARTGGNRTRVDTVAGDTGAIVDSMESDFTEDFLVGDYRVNTNNDLFGVHFGAELVEKHDEWTFGFRSRIGGLYNFADRRSRLLSITREEQLVSFQNVPRLDENGNPVLDGNGDPIIDTVNTFTELPVQNIQAQKLDDGNLVFLAELGAFGSYQVRPNLFLRAGYDFMLLSGLALASENLGFTNGFPALNVQGTTILHGASWGFETFW